MFHARESGRRMSWTLVTSPRCSYSRLSSGQLLSGYLTGHTGRRPNSDGDLPLAANSLSASCTCSSNSHHHPSPPSSSTRLAGSYKPSPAPPSTSPQPQPPSSTSPTPSPPPPQPPHPSCPPQHPTQPTQKPPSTTPQATERPIPHPPGEQTRLPQPGFPAEVQDPDDAVADARSAGQLVVEAGLAKDVPWRAVGCGVVAAVVVVVVVVVVVWEGKATRLNSGRSVTLDFKLTTCKPFLISNLADAHYSTVTMAPGAECAQAQTHHRYPTKLVDLFSFIPGYLLRSPPPFCVPGAVEQTEDLAVPRTAGVNLVGCCWPAQRPLSLEPTARIVDDWAILLRLTCPPAVLKVFAL